MTERLGRLGATVTGIDPTQEAINTASLHLPSNLKKNVNYIKCELSDVNETYDVVLASEVIEHVNNPGVFIKEVSEKINKEGSAFITTISRNVESWLFGIVLSENLLRIVEPGTHQWDKFINPDELIRMCTDNGLEVMDQQGWMLDIFRFKTFLTSYDRIGYLVHCLKK